MTTIQRIRLSDLAARLGCELHGDPELEITGVAGMEQAGPSELTFLANPKYAPKVKNTRAGAILVKEPLAGTGAGAAWFRRIRITILRATLAMFYQPPRPEARHPSPSVHRGDGRESAKARRWGRSR